MNTLRTLTAVAAFGAASISSIVVPDLPTLPQSKAEAPPSYAEACDVDDLDIESAFLTAFENGQHHRTNAATYFPVETDKEGVVLLHVFPKGLHFYEHEGAFFTIFKDRLSDRYVVRSSNSVFIDEDGDFVPTDELCPDPKINKAQSRRFVASTNDGVVSFNAEAIGVDGYIAPPTVLVFIARKETPALGAG